MSRPLHLWLRPRAGFTLIEMLAAMFCLSLLVLMLVSVFNQGQKGWIYGENRVTTFQEARKALDMMARDLALALSSSNLHFSGISATELRFVAPLGQPSADQADLAEVGYRFEPATRSLIRSYTPPQSAYLGVQWQPFLPLDNLFGTASPVLSNTLRSLRFDYIKADGTESGSWPAATNLPTAVRISLELFDWYSSRQVESGVPEAVLTNQALRAFSALVYLHNAKP